MDETRTVFSYFMTVAPVVRLTWLPLPAGRQQGAITHQMLHTFHLRLWWKTTVVGQGITE